MRPHPARGWSRYTTHNYFIEVVGDNTTINSEFAVSEILGKEQPATD
jgi:hypothetical protein